MMLEIDTFLKVIMDYMINFDVTVEKECIDTIINESKIMTKNGMDIMWYLIKIYEHTCAY